MKTLERLQETVAEYVRRFHEKPAMIKVNEQTFDQIVWELNVNAGVPDGRARTVLLEYEGIPVCIVQRTVVITAVGIPGIRKKGGVG